MAMRSLEMEIRNGKLEIDGIVVGDEYVILKKLENSQKWEELEAHFKQGVI